MPYLAGMCPMPVLLRKQPKFVQLKSETRRIMNLPFQCWMRVFVDLLNSGTLGADCCEKHTQTKQVIHNFREDYTLRIFVWISHHFGFLIGHWFLCYNHTKFGWFLTILCEIVWKFLCDFMKPHKNVNTISHKFFANHIKYLWLLHKNQWPISTQN
jgi:hypothetical protein